MKPRILLLALLASVLLVPAAFGSGQKDQAAAGDFGTPGKYPLAKRLTLSGGLQGDQGTVLTDPNNMPVFQKFERETNVHVEWTIYDSPEKRQIAFAAGEYPDFSYSTGLWGNLITEQAGLGVIVDLLPYLGKGITPNLDKAFETYPDILPYAKSPEGRLNAFPSLFRLESNYLEQNFMINKTWLDRLGLKVPTTVEELRNVLVAFRDRDPNGNGKKDEIPFGFVANDGFAQHLMSLYGIWGLPAKDGPVIKNGRVLYAAVQPGYKDFIKYMAGLYKEGLIDPEAFTQNVSQFDSKVAATTGPLYGFIIAQRGYTDRPGTEHFVSIAPPRVQGTTPEIWVHPGYIATKNLFFMTKRNKYPEHTVAWFDYTFTFENSMQGRYGLAGEGVVQVNGKWTVNKEKTIEWTRKNAYWDFPINFSGNDIESKWTLTPEQAFLKKNYDAYYRQYKAKEAWNRPEFSAAEIKEVNTIRPEVDKLWKTKQAQWIIGGNIDAEWDSYLQAMQSMKLDRYIELCQAAYDRYFNGLTKK